MYEVLGHNKEFQKHKNKVDLEEDDDDGIFDPKKMKAKREADTGNLDAATEAKEKEFLRQLASMNAYDTQFNRDENKKDKALLLSIKK